MMDTFLLWFMSKININQPTNQSSGLRNYNVTIVLPEYIEVTGNLYNQILSCWKLWIDLANKKATASRLALGN